MRLGGLAYINLFETPYPDCKVLNSLRAGTPYTSCSGGGSGTVTAHLYFFTTTSSRLPAVGFRKACGSFGLRARRRAYGSRSLTPMPYSSSGVPSHLWLGTGRRVVRTAFRPHSREAEFLCLGMQSYSRRLCLSRGKHYRLYP